MAIVIIKGKKGVGKSSIANALRNSQIGQGKGALLIDEDQDGELKYLIEKIMDGQAIPDEVPEDWAESLSFKPDPVIILVNEKAKELDNIELMLPGFKAKFAPVLTVSIAQD